MLKWPDAQTVVEALREWLKTSLPQYPEVVRIGYFGSYARGDWGPGSDLDLVAVVTDSSEPFNERSIRWDLTRLPVPAEILVYTEPEWQTMQAAGGRWARTLARETIWMDITDNRARSALHL